MTHTEKVCSSVAHAGDAPPRLRAPFSPQDPRQGCGHTGVVCCSAFVILVHSSFLHDLDLYPHQERSSTKAWPYTFLYLKLAWTLFLHMIMIMPLMLLNGSFHIYMEKILLASDTLAGWTLYFQATPWYLLHVKLVQSNLYFVPHYSSQYIPPVTLILSTWANPYNLFIFMAWNMYSLLVLLGCNCSLTGVLHCQKWHN